MRNKILMTLVALFAMTAGAWAADYYVVGSFTDWSPKEAYKLTLNTGCTTTTEYMLTVELPADAQFKVVQAEGISIQAWFPTGIDNNYGENGELPGAGWYTIYFRPNQDGNEDWFYNLMYVATSEAPEPAPDGPKVTWDPATKTGTFEMPAYDVEIAPIYAPTAKWATKGDAVLAPTAIEGIFAGTSEPIVKAGTVAKTGDNVQGTAMYFATTDAEMTAEKAAKANGWLSTLPTAAGYDDATTVYVWYYIKGADTPDGQEASAENTFNDLEICATPLKVEVLSNKFDIALKAANANTIEAGKATVKVGDAAATVTDGKIEKVKMGSKVTITAKDGYKFRKAEGKKGIVALKTLNVGGDCPGTITYAEGETWGQAIENHPTENAGWTIGSSGSILYNYYGVWLGNNRVRKEDAITPGLGYYTE